MAGYGRDPNALGVLSKFMGRSNAGNLPTSYLGDAQGYGDMLPGADSPELKIAQEQIAKETGMGFSRDALRSNVLDSLRKQLGLQNIEHQQKKEQLAVGPTVGGEYDIRQQEVANRGGADVARITGDSRLNAAEATASARDASMQALLAAAAGGNRSVSVSGVGSIGREPSQALPANVLNSLNKMREQAKASEPWGLSKLVLRSPSKVDQLETAISEAQKFAGSGSPQTVDEYVQQQGWPLTPEEMAQFSQLVQMFQGR